MQTITSNNEMFTKLFSQAIFTLVIFEMAVDNVWIVCDMSCLLFIFSELYEGNIGNNRLLRFMLLCPVSADVIDIQMHNYSLWQMAPPLS